MFKQDIKPVLKKAIVAITTLLFLQVAHAKQLRVLAYGDSNTWGWSPIKEGFPAVRYADHLRWSGVLDIALKENVTVIVDGLVGRTTNLDNKTAIGKLAPEDFNGQRSLASSIAKNAPIDLVIIMLGTNDLQVGVNRSATEIASAAFSLAELVTSIEQPTFSNYSAPQVLVITPPILGDTSRTPLHDLFSAGIVTSQHLSTAFQKEAKAKGLPSFNANDIIKTDGIDGIHLSVESHQKLGEALVNKVTEILAK